MESQQQLTPLQQAAASRKLIEAEIIARAWSDEAFRAKLESDPAAALAEAGFPLPDGRVARVTREAPGTLEIVLPAKPAAVTEMDEAELEAVAGGEIRKEGQKCQLAEEAKKDWNKGGAGGVAAAIVDGAVLGIIGIFGGSWGWN